jgi:hypothetical protein
MDSKPIVRISNGHKDLFANSISIYDVIPHSSFVLAVFFHQFQIRIVNFIFMNYCFSFFRDILLLRVYFYKLFA